MPEATPNQEAWLNGRLKEREHIVRYIDDIIAIQEGFMRGYAVDKNYELAARAQSLAKYGQQLRDRIQRGV